MATQDISQLVVEVKSQGIQTATNQLERLAKASDKAESAVKKLGSVVVSTASTTATAQAQAAASGVGAAQDAAQKSLTIAQRRDVELYNMRVRAEAALQGIKERRDMEEYSAAQGQAEKLRGIQEKRDIEMYTSAVSQAERIKAIQEKRDMELYTEAVAQAERIAAVQQKRDTELYMESVKQAERQKAIQEKRDMEEYTEAVKQAERIASIQQKRDTEMYTEATAAAARMKAIQEKRDIEEYTAARTEAERIVAIQQKRDIEMHLLRERDAADQLASQEKQRRMNASFQTATIASQIRTAREAQAYSALGGNATERFGSAAATADINALIAAQERLRVATGSATNAQNRQNAAFAEAHALTRGFAGSLGALWTTYGNIVGMGIGIAIGASLKGIITVGKDVEQTLENIRVLGGATMEEIGRMSAAILTLGKGSQGPREVAEALNVLTLAGLSAGQALLGVGAALNLAVAGGVSVEKSAETLVQVGTALNYTASGFDHVSDVIAKTAAASMSSVDSISNAFKSAAAVGSVYGASLRDIALGLAAVANLGIQGTSAGTALKNFYKDLSASTQKVTQTLKDMKLSISDFRDSDGFMLPLIDVVKKLDGGFNSLEKKASKLAEVKMFSQQAVREWGVLRDMLHQASDKVDEFGNKYKSKLDEVQGEISRAAAFSTLAAIAMGQTTANQMKSVGNTIQSVFAEVFTSISPQIGSVARSLKSAFNSEGFKSTLSTIATSVADLTKYLVDHAGALKVVAEAYIGLKLVEFATGVVKMATAFDIAAVAARGFWTTLGPIGIAIAGLTYLWVLYKASKDKALDNKAAEDNLQEYADRVKEAANKELAVLEMKKKGWTDAKIAQEQANKADEDASARVADTVLAGIAKMKAEKEKMWAGMSEADRKMVGRIQATPGSRDQILASGGSAFADYIKQELLYNEAVAKGNKLIAETKSNTLMLVTARKESAAIDEENARKARVVSEGDGTLSGKPDAKGANDEYNRVIASFQNDIKAATKDLAQFRETEDSRFRAAEIGRLQLINETADAEVAAYAKVAKAAEGQRDKAHATPNKKADEERFQGVIDRANQDAEQAEKMRNQNKTAALRAMHAEQISLEVKALEQRGEFKKAADLKWSSDGKIALEQAEQDLKLYGDQFPWLSDLVKQYAATRDAAMNSATVKENTLAFSTALIQVEETLKGVKAASFGGSIGTVMDTATKATEKFNVALANAKKKRDLLAANANTPEAQKALEQANKDLLAVADKQKAMWKEVGQTITSSLKDAFGTAGESLGKLNEAMITYQQSENATSEDRMKQYGDMAQAASGFFDKQSKGYKVLNGIAQVFHVAQMARTLVQTAASVAAGAAEMFAQGGFAGFAGVAAMGAVMAGLGWAMSGASAHGADPKLDAEYVQKHQGTGTVLGDADAKSKSISESISNLKSNSDIMLPLTQAMLHSLKNIEASMMGLAKLAVQNGVTDGSNFNVQTGTTGMFGGSFLKNTLMGTNAVGGAIGGASLGFMLGGPIGAAIGAIGGAIVGKIASLWGKTSKEITDSGLQIGGKVSDLEAGRGINQYAAVKTTSSSWFGLSKSSNTDVKTMGAGDEISRQFGLVFTNLEDSLKSAATVLGTSSNAVGAAIDNVVISTTKISLKDLKGQELTDAINNVMSASMDQIAKAAYPKMEAFQQIGEGYAQTVLRVATGVEQANVALEKFGITAVNYADVQNKQGDVAFEIAKQSMLAVETTKTYVKSQTGGWLAKLFGVTERTDVVSKLSGIGEIIESMTGSVDDLTTAYKALTDIRKKMNGIGLNGDGLNLNVLKGAGGLQQMQTALATYSDKYFTEQEKSAIMLKSVSAEFEKLNLSLPANKKALRDLIATVGVSTPETAKLTGELLALSGSYSDLVDEANKANSASMDSLKSTIDGLKSFGDAIKAFRSNLLLGDLSTLNPVQKYAESRSQYESMLAKAMAGDATAKDNITAMAQAYLEASRVVNASSDEYGNTFSQVQRDMTSLEAMTGTQLTDAQKQLEQLQTQTDGIADLNATASSILDALKTAPTIGTNAPVVSSPSNDNSDVVEELKAMREQMAASDAANQKKIDDLTAALYDATDRAAEKTVQGSYDAMESTTYRYKTLETLER